MKRISFLLLFILLISVPNSLRADAKDGEYPVKISLWNAYEDVNSMGASALSSDATLYVKGGAGRLRVSFVPLNYMDFRGFLGELQVNGINASVLSSYPDIDAYNDPNTGTDAKMKGRLYPKVLEFPIDLSKDVFPCQVYVPVMAELGFGNQSARLKVHYPSELFSAEQTEPEKGALSEPKEKDAKAEDKKDEADKDGEEVSKEEKFYTLPVRLWHAVEDKPSMGNEAMQSEAILHEKDGKMTVYIGSSKVKVSNLIASLSKLYVDDGSAFVQASPLSFNMKVEGEEALRPEVFRFPLKSRTEFLEVMVDPKVAVMGDDPLKARLKFDFAGRKEISEKEAGLYQLAKNGKAKPAFDPSAEEKRSDKGIEISVPAGAFETDYEFLARELRGEELAPFQKEFDPLDTVKVYELSALAPMERIEYEQKPPFFKSREAFQPKKALQVSLPLEQGVSDLKLYRYGEEKSELKFTREGDRIRFSLEQFEPVILVYQKGDGASAEAAAEKLSPSGANPEPGKVLPKAATGAESKVFILFFTLLMLILIAVSGYFCKKYLRILQKELSYGEELKLRMLKKTHGTLNEEEGQ